MCHLKFIGNVVDFWTFLKIIFRPGKHNLYKNENFFPFPFPYNAFLEVELFFLSPLTTANHTLTAIPGLSASPQNFTELDISADPFHPASHAER